VDTNNPSQVAAILALHLLDAARSSYWRAVLRARANRTYLEQLARTLSGDQNLTLEPYIPYLVQMIVSHFADRPDAASLPTEQGILDWIAENGGISAILLERTRWEWGWRVFPRESNLS
jgi:hypothetical protein